MRKTSLLRYRLGERPPEATTVLISINATRSRPAAAARGASLVYLRRSGPTQPFDRLLLREFQESRYRRALDIYAPQRPARSLVSSEYAETAPLETG